MLGKKLMLGIDVGLSLWILVGSPELGIMVLPLSLSPTIMDGSSLLLPPPESDTPVIAKAAKTTATAMAPNPKNATGPLTGPLKYPYAYTFTANPTNIATIVTAVRFSMKSIERLFLSLLCWWCWCFRFELLPSLGLL